MYVLYLDESGAHGEAQHFVLAGIAVFEREAHWFAQDLNDLQKRYFPVFAEPIEFHAAQLRAPAGKVPEPFSSLPRERTRQLITEVYQIIRTHRGVLFATAVDKAYSREDPYERSFEELVNRFDLFLCRQNARAADTGREEQRGLVVVAESAYRNRLEILGRRFRGGATRWRETKTLADVPFFVPASNTRLLQLADFCANAVHGRYNGGYARDFDLIAGKFDREGGRVHGLVHLSKDYDCQCLACLSRALSAGQP